ncbi:hypothetical protein CRG98_005376 [Punica granatum]|uniref:Uncharacterized protein n=1 Tax=Punica granatum TaxID=22663 RepID=A0A2I0L0L5_PUNGR|nr:hypothetical protein CRG98_005376 [Punica granatum]
MHESWLDITRELDRSNGHSKNQSVLLPPVYPIPLDPGDSTALDLWVENNRVDLKLFSENDHYSHLRRFIRVHPITLGANDHHGHLEGSLGDPEPLTLPQNAIGNLRGDVRLDLCQSDLFNF